MRRRLTLLEVCARKREGAGTVKTISWSNGEGCVGWFYFALATLVAKFLQLKVLKDLAVVAKLTKVSCKIRVVGYCKQRTSTC